MVSNDSESAFGDYVRTAFRFLVEDFGFEITSESDTAVRYETPHVFANIRRLASGPEVGMLIFTVGLRGRPRDRLDLNELRLLAGAAKPAVRDLPGDLAGHLTHIAKQLQIYGVSA